MIRKLCLTLAALFGLSVPVLADPVARLSEAMSALRAGDWEQATSRAAAARDPVVRDLVEWHRLRAGQGSVSEANAFLSRRPDWPGLSWLRRQSEQALAGSSDRTILSFFAAHPPQTALGALLHARALRRAGRSGDADARLILAWRSLPMSAMTEARFLDSHARLLAPHHADRLNEMIWDGNLADADRLLGLVSADQRALSQARLALRRGQRGVDALIGAVPKSLANDPGLAFDRFRWREQRGLRDGALDLLQTRSAVAGGLGRPAAWAPQRLRLARLTLWDGDATTAYRIAATHQMQDGSRFAELEWLAGYIALTYLRDPDRAATHFSTFQAAVATPISLGRAGYWLGLALRATGDTSRAATAFAAAAQHQTSFYGLLAAEVIGQPFDLPAPTAPVVAPTSTLLDAALLLRAAGETGLAVRFVTQLADSLPVDDAVSLGRHLAALPEPHLAVRVGKRLARRNVIVPEAHYPLHPIAEDGLRMAPDMLLTIARRESEFDHAAVSQAGARGLMQLMPGTARDMAAQRIDIPAGDPGHSTARLLRDSSYNAELGAAYLQELAGQFDGNPILMAAAYNAGPTRALEWIETLGDPRAPDTDIVYWIESIPFAETRNYVMRVAESLPIYRARLGRTALPQQFSAELKGSGLRAFAPDRE